MHLPPEALQAFTAALGAAHVITCPEARAAAETATFATTAEIPAILRPADRAEVQACVAIATTYRIPLYPISRGKNWGLGSRVPTGDGAVLLDLGRLDRISAYDPTMGCITVEPGVTFGALTAFLKAQGAAHFVSMTGSTLESSVVGNTIERGDGVGPLGDRAAHVCALEVVLPTGECVETGFARYSGARTAQIYRWGVGPALDGLFFQSNLGIVTRMTVWLTRAPAVLLALRFTINDPSALGPVTDAIRELRLEGTIRGWVALWNDYRVLSTRMGFPWDAMDGSTPLDRATVRRLMPGAEASWYGMSAVYAASPLQAQAAQERITSLLGPLCDGLVFYERAAGQEIAKATVIHPLTHEASLFGSIATALEFLLGQPQEASLASVYFRKRSPPPAHDRDPDRDRCGVLWSCPVIPLRAEDSLRATALCEQVIFDHGYEPLLALLALHDRTGYLVPILCYDREVPGEDARARACHDALLGALIAAGYPPYRLGIQSMEALPPASDASAALLRRLKAAVDPAGILAPGRYEPRVGDAE